MARGFWDEGWTPEDDEAAFMGDEQRDETRQIREDERRELEAAEEVPWWMRADA